MEWRLAEFDPLRRRGLRAATVDNILFVMGGWGHPGHEYPYPVYSWDMFTETWQEAGNLTVPRAFHAVVAVSPSIISSDCLHAPTGPLSTAYPTTHTQMPEWTRHLGCHYNTSAYTRPGL